jgi:hypothetical protein
VTGGCRAGPWPALALILGSCTECASLPASDAGLDVGPDGLNCYRYTYTDGFGVVPERRYLDWIGELDDEGRLRIGTHNTYVQATLLDPSGQFLDVWDIVRRDDSAGSVRWDRGSIGAVLYRQRNPPNDPLDAYTYLSWRPEESETFSVEIEDIYDRWPYLSIGACGVDTEQVVPTRDRLWFFRSIRCPADPESGSPFRARLHGFDRTGNEITPAEGIPLREIFLYTNFSPTMQAERDGGVSYLVYDRGPDDTEEDALHWERRDASGALVARSEALATFHEIGTSSNLWTQVTDDDATVVYAAMDEPSGGAFFARVEADGSIRFRHQFRGIVANNGTNRSRVYAWNGGILALVAYPDGSERSIVEIDAEGEVVHAPAYLRRGTPLDVGEGRSYTAALAPDAWGLTIAVGRETEHPLISRYDWNGTLVFENTLEDSPPATAPLHARPDGRGGAYVLATSAGGTVYQHFDRHGRPAVAYEVSGCLIDPQLERHVPIERPPIDAGLDASRVRRDVWVDPLDAGVELPDAVLDEMDSGSGPLEDADQDASPE